MQKRVIGQTGISVSLLGLGTVKFGRNAGVKYPEAFELPSEQTLKTLLNTAKEAGINFLDTAPAYGTSEERLGQLIKHERHEWVLATKAGEAFHQGQSCFDFSAQSIVHSVERSLERLCTDYLDIVLIHSSGEDERIINEDGVFDTLQRMKEQGKIRAYGMSTKTVAGGLLAVQQSDLVMVTHHPGYTDEAEVIRKAHHLHKGVLIKKAFASGHLNQIASDNPITASLSFIFKEPGVTSVVMGTINPQHLLMNIEACQNL